MDRRTIIVDGIVQGVGFRPFVFHLAKRFQLQGFVRNCTSGVWIEVEGETAFLDGFLKDLTASPPPTARIEHIAWESSLPQGDREFRIIPSDECGDGGRVFIAPDIATCAACLKELFDPSDRRYRYPFSNCCHCGPRLTIVLSAPYDRERTTMAGFAMCGDCRAEFDDPANRRFHAQPTACPVCGPQLRIIDGQGRRVDCADPLAFAVAALRDGKVGAVKGLGGYHLVCAANDGGAVADLRRRKGRDEKPFAVMVENLEAARKIGELSEREANLLSSARRPIVLVRKRLGISIANEIAPRNPWLGVMLPYTPLHYLLLADMREQPLVMTSGNGSDEPIAFEDEDAVARLRGVADFFLAHNRPIQTRCDDSVTRVVAGCELPIRRSRGYAPEPLFLPFECPAPILALGGQMKTTFAIGRGRSAFVSHHLGDLDHYEAYRAYADAIHRYEDLFAVQPSLWIHDLHPDYASTRYALECRRVRNDIETRAVQHHHAHLASCMADNQLHEPVIGIIWDGTGYGTDAAVWGGEFLVGDYHGFRRGACLRYVPMPGGDQAIREPWRMAAAHLHDAGMIRSHHAPRDGLRHAERDDYVQQLLEKRSFMPLTSSIGRLFDAVAALVGIRQTVSYEGQAAMELEWIATEEKPDGSYPFELVDGREKGPAEWVIDTRPIIRAIVEDVQADRGAARISRRFHSALVDIAADACVRLRKRTELNDVVLSGGVFMNALLTTEICDRLGRDGFRVFRHERVPPNDGGLSLGQLAIAAACIRTSTG